MSKLPLVVVPPVKSAQEARDAHNRRLLTVLLPIGMAVHCSFVPTFLLFGVPSLALANLGSIAMWVAAIWLRNKGRVEAATIITQLEITIHGVVATLILGTLAGFHLYLLIAAASASIVRVRGSSVTLVANVFLLALLVLWGVLAEQPPVPLHLVRMFAVINAVAGYAFLYAIGSEFERSTARGEVALEAANARSEAILHNVLPRAIADRLKAGSGVIADRFESATVVFADIAGFTPLSARISAEELVRLLDSIFTRLDAIAAREGLEKIKTIGDAYMAASGIPVPRADHAIAAARFALAARDAIDAVAAETGHALAIRIGMACGPVVAGVIGTSKFAYDLWGDTVNVASRMESHGEPGKVHVTEALAEMLRGDTELVERGLIDVKGRGEMRTFFVVGLRAHATIAA
ncbi:MAG: adenylate/guanylate cyclase domain-containing protein [Proteobacteria bacterium]|nr:adenylate/guanylate cyclase domain-containing protein [Pseudomonadota bacterium]